MFKNKKEEIELMANKIVQMKESSLRTAIFVVDILLARDQMDDKKELEAG